MQSLIILLQILDLAEAVLRLCLALIWLLLAAYESLFVPPLPLQHRHF